MFNLLVIENIHPEDLSHQGKVEALDMLGEMAAEHRLRRAARDLNLSPHWLSRRLSCAAIQLCSQLSSKARLRSRERTSCLRRPSPVARCGHKGPRERLHPGWAEEPRNQLQITSPTLELADITALTHSRRSSA